MKKLKRIIIGIIAGALVLTGVYFALNNQSANTVKVYPVSMLSTGEDYYNQSMYQGMVVTDQLQPIYISSTQEIKEVLVTEGQEVKKGDILLTYDSTLSEISIVRKQLEIQKYQLELDRLYQELNVINTYRPGVKIYIQMDSGFYKTQAIVPEIKEVYGDIVINLIFKDINTTDLVAPVLELYSRVSESQEASVKVEKEPVVTPTETGFTYTYEQLLIKDGVVREVLYTPLQLNQEGTVIENEGTYQSIHDESVQVIYNQLSIINQLVDESSTPVEPEPVKYPNLLSGSGTQEDPYRFLYNEKMSINSAFMNELLSESEKVFVRFDKYTNDDVKEPLIMAWHMLFEKIEGSNVFTLLELQLGPDDQEPPIDGEPPIDDFPPIIEEPPSIVYTAAEIQKMRTDKESEIRNADLSRKTASVELENLEIERNNNFILAKLDGVVGSLIDIEEAKSTGNQFFQVSSSGSFIVESSIGELDLETVKVGDLMSIMSYDTGMMVEGEVISISKYPANNQMFYNPDQNISMYPIKIKVDKSANLNNNSWVEIRPIANMDSPTQGNLYLMNAFIRTDEAEPYVLVAENGKLVKRIVRTGRSQYGQFTEILDNAITMEDLVAFPYGKGLQIGAPVQESSIEDLYQGG